MTLIQAVTVGSGGAANIEFTSIPGTYTDLLLKLSVRSDRANATDNFSVVRFNEDSGANYSIRRLRGNGSAASSSTTSLVTQLSIDATIPGANATVSTFASTEIYIPNYASSNNKSIQFNSVGEDNVTQAFQFLTAGLWSNSSAISSIKLFSNNANYSQYSTAYLYGVTSAAVGAKATGGNIISQDADYFYHTFTSSGTFTPTQSITADYLVVAGGGSASADAQAGGGGGGGGLRCTVGATGGGGSLETPLSLTTQAYTVTVGAGGAGGTSQGSSGSNSVFSTITSTGGGAGGRGLNGSSAINGFSGGSGGGGGSSNVTSTSTGGTGTANQGYAGGSGRGDGGGANKASGGGGGAGGTGGNQNGSGAGGAGGIGVQTNISGTFAYYAGGGGGAGVNAGGAGGLGGGATGGAGNSSVSTSGTTNTGGGGATAYKDNAAFPAGNANGGSGIVIVRYAK
jgi:hypothetical protein